MIKWCEIFYFSAVKEGVQYGKDVKILQHYQAFSQRFDASLHIVRDKMMRGVSRNYFVGDEESSFGVDISKEILVWNVHESVSTATNASNENIDTVAKVCDNDVNKEAIFGR